ncbi:MAG: DNA polymerase III subunit beta [Candidatus Dormibacteraeota bacterium]|nr:DNA polymerase III subunit beta [Candidatus Dormibacteraeota bacterium]
MKLTCQPSVLSQALQTVSRAISTRTTLPILNNVLLETTDQGLALTATNLEIGIRKVIPAEVQEDGGTTAPARLLTEFAGTLPVAETLEMSLDTATQMLAMRCGRFDTHVKCIEADEFPPGPRPDEGDRIEIALHDLLAAVEQTQMAASTDEARPVLTGELLQINRASPMLLVATDGHRLAERHVKATVAADLEAKLIVPARALAELPRAFKGEPGEVEVIVSKARNQVFFRAGNAEVTSRLIDGSYPNYAQVIPTKSSTQVHVNAAELMQTVRAVSLFARDSANVIRLRASADTGTLTLTATTNEVGDSRAELAATVKGEEIQIAFNARYLIEALSVMGGETVELQFDGPLGPGLIRPPGSEDYLYVIMPIRVAM